MNIGLYRFIVVTPVYEDTQACTRLFRELKAKFPKDIFVVAVDDGSVREPLNIGHLTECEIEGVVLRLRRNIGHQRAIAVGLGFVSEYVHPNQLVIVMDSDGEDLPSTISKLLDHLQSEEVDVAVAQRGNRVETLRFKIFYICYKIFFGLMTGKNICFGNFMAMKPHALKRLVAMHELSIHVAGSVLASGLRTSMCTLDRGQRYFGKSKMNFVGLVLHGFKGVMVFSQQVLVRVGIACAVVGSLSIIGALAAIVLKLIGFSTPGWFSVALGILVLMFMQTGALALMTLMLTGIMRGGTVTSSAAYRDYIEKTMSTATKEERS